MEQYEKSIYQIYTEYHAEKVFFLWKARRDCILNLGAEGLHMGKPVLLELGIIQDLLGLFVGNGRFAHGISSFGKDYSREIWICIGEIRMTGPRRMLTVPVTGLLFQKLMILGAGF